MESCIFAFYHSSNELFEFLIMEDPLKRFIYLFESIPIFPSLPGFIMLKNDRFKPKKVCVLALLHNFFVFNSGGYTKGTFHQDFEIKVTER